MGPCLCLASKEPEVVRQKRRMREWHAAEVSTTTVDFVAVTTRLLICNGLDIR